MADVLLSYLREGGGVKDSRVLELGCVYLKNLFFLPGRTGPEFRYFGLDSCKDPALRTGRTDPHCNVNTIVGDMFDCPLKAETMEMIISFGLILFSQRIPPAETRLIPKPADLTDQCQFKEIVVGLFFTFEVSLVTWDKAGILKREIALYKKLAGSGIRTRLFTYGDEKDLEYLNCLGDNITPVPMFRSRTEGKWKRFFTSWLVPLQFKKTVRECDIIKTNQMWGAWAGLVCKLLLGKIWVLRCGFEHHRFLQLMNAGFRDRAFSRLYGWLAYRLADSVIWSNAAEREWAVKKFRLKPGDPRFHVIPNYVDTGLFKPVSFAVGPVTRVITVARLAPQKNLDLIIRALKGSDYELEIVGEGSLRRQLMELSRNLGVKVNFYGALPHEQIPERLNNAGIFVLCSRYEGLPKSLLEAMSCGMPVVGSEVDGIREVIEHGRTGLLCKTDPASIRAAVDRLVSDERLRSELGGRAREHIEKNYSLESVVRQELELYNKIIAGK